MGHSVTIGGDRLGAGKRNKAYLHGYERSTHDLSYLWRSTMAPGTLVPFMSELALPGDTFDIELNCEVLTHPTIGPLFGTYNVNLDVFQIPIRLYQAQLHMNMLNIGLNMAQVKLPQMQVYGVHDNGTEPSIDNLQINPSCILSYLNVRGVGFHSTNPALNASREFNAIPLLGYWDIYKNYYANKQEELGAVIHQSLAPDGTNFPNDVGVYNAEPAVYDLEHNPVGPYTYNLLQLFANSTIIINAAAVTNSLTRAGNIVFYYKNELGEESLLYGPDLFNNWAIDQYAQRITGSNPTAFALANPILLGGITYIANDIPSTNEEPFVYFFPLGNIDTMRQNILQHNDYGNPYIINSDSDVPYGLIFEPNDTTTKFSQQYNQEGLALKPYKSDLFNNWISTEWIDGPDGINEITAISTLGDEFKIDELLLKKKIYDMLNRIAISGGSYDDWMDAVYDHDRRKSAENPMYLGGLIRNIVFQEVISNSATEDEPLGSLAGRGKMGGKYKGGKIIAKIDEPSYLMGIISITPNVDYSQGNKWDMNLKTMDDLHKPALDSIGFQDLITDQMAWWDTRNNMAEDPSIQLFNSAGKQPAWINYMTNVNVVRGNFADPSQEMFMTLNRQYEPRRVGSPAVISIKDLTTYIDPAKFNHIFADTRRDAQNFWTQIAVNITARRKMSAKVIPNL